MDQSKLDRLRYLCTVPTHSPAIIAEEARGRAIEELAAMTNRNFAQKCYEIVREEANAYSCDTALCRMERAKRLIACGVSEKYVLEALETQTENILEAMIVYGGAVHEKIYSGGF